MWIVGKMKKEDVIRANQTAAPRWSLDSAARASWPRYLCNQCRSESRRRPHLPFQTRQPRAGILHFRLRYPAAETAVPASAIVVEDTQHRDRLMCARLWYSAREKLWRPPRRAVRLRPRRRWACVESGFPLRDQWLLSLAPHDHIYMHSAPLRRPPTAVIAVEIIYIRRGRPPFSHPRTLQKQGLGKLARVLPLKRCSRPMQE